jgi:hypothetical protein
LNEKNYHISLDEFPFICEIIFRSYNQYILHNIDRQQYLSRMLNRRDGQTLEYFTIWFQNFLCEPNSDWIDYQILLNQWTQCFVGNQDIFSKIIKQMDTLIERWKNAASKDSQRSNFFIKHMVGQCFRQGRNQ